MARHRRSPVQSFSFHPPEWFRRFAIWILAMFGLAAIFLIGVVSFRIARAWNTTTWFGGEPFRILYIYSSNQSEDTKAVKLVSIWPETTRTVEVDIPVDVYVSSVGGYGNYRLGALAPLGRVEKVGNKLLVDSVRFELGVPIHLVIDKSQSTQPKVDWGLVKKLLLQQGLMGTRAFNEAMAARSLVSQVKQNLTEKIELSERNVVRTKPAIDGTMVRYFEPALVERFSLDYLATVWKEAATLKVAIVNTTGKSNMATQWSRLARIGGYDVVNVTDQQTVEEQTLILIRDEKLKDLPFTNSLAQLYPMARIMPAATEQYRADVAVLIGMDAWRWLNEREVYLNDDN